jgi:large subunit ribosomal protein L6
MATAANIDKDSRVGKKPITLPSGVTVSVSGREVTVKGPKGQLTQRVHDKVEVVQQDGAVHVKAKKGTGRDGRQYQGLARALVANAVRGVAEGYKVSLDMYGVGYRAELKGQDLHLALGMSHPIKYALPDSVKARVEIIDEAGVKRPRLHLESYDKKALGQVASRIRTFRPPEPYKGKGVRYTGERVREKAGKAGKGAATA